TIYMWRIQASCDRFLYSTLVYGKEFNTITESNPDCGSPSNLQASVDGSGRSATVSWTAGENNQSWLLMHKEKSSLKYESREVRTPSFTFNDLKPNTVYTWRVQAACDNSLYSSLVSGDEFTTAEASLSSTQFADKLRMRVNANQIEIENADGVYIKTLEVISMNGKRLKTYGIHSSDNVLIPHTLPFGPAVFRITGKGGETAVYKLMVK
ncbi:MAG: fibronectin type III domain-containing protein, partial [Bacteroidales bacterium]|nr:fibronectin type III domain-containing protein [Bacteroidales bacterium]